ncbi:MAG: hypothetical protein V7641_3633 [Blastocatellia bacterium]
MDKHYFKLPKAEQDVLLESWLQRQRVFRFPTPATPERVAIISPHIGRTWSAPPFIEVVWQQRRIIAISMLGFASLSQDRRAEQARLLADGMELLRTDISKQEVLQEVSKRLSTVSLSHPGRPERYQNQDEFLAALEQAAAQLELEHSAISQPNVAALLDADERQIRLWCGKHGVDWSAWKRERAAKEGKR